MKGRWKEHQSIIHRRDGENQNWGKKMEFCCFLKKYNLIAQISTRVESSVRMQSGASFEQLVFKLQSRKVQNKLVRSLPHSNKLSKGNILHFRGRFGNDDDTKHFFTATNKKCRFPVALALSASCAASPWCYQSYRRCMLENCSPGTLYWWELDF